MGLTQSENQFGKHGMCVQRARTSMVSRIFTRIEAADRLTVLIVASVTLLLIGILDYASGEELASSVFYFLPVAVVGWRFGYRTSGMFALAATLVWVIVVIALGISYSSSFAAVWDGVSRFIIYFAFAVLLSHVRQSLEQAKHMAMTDHLTGVANARYFIELAERELEHCRRYGRPLTLAYIDIDDFKCVNDELGHSGGDRVIQAVAHALVSSVRLVDHVARQGGDEFMLFLHEVDARQAGTVLQQIHNRATSLLESSGYGVTLSIGGVTWNVPPETLDAAIHAADQVMYEVKRGNKGRVLHRFADEIPGPETSHPTPEISDAFPSGVDPSRI
jgi:diguanylate cyclase (GGDEF)-like protein